MSMQSLTSIRQIWLKTVMLCGLLLLPVLGVSAAERPTAPTNSANAEAQVMRAIRKDGELKIDLRFETTADTFGGEIIYSGLTPNDLDTQFYIEANGQRWPLSAAGKQKTPKELRLNFSYDRKKNPRVGSWQGIFSAPPAEVAQVTLKLPGLPPIPSIAIVDR
ncbi:hypothetical protein BIY26_12940 [Brenneria goodwinii]|uniref:Uncharacterized protein n=1 Tax=Brenneria goodwinii TaxID=1109412 RepID=A0A0G4JZC9_9GAMM|nr:hypothetical protein [Brenneria goodwinii]ATA23620.1 hypothetical protein AWC36_05595 [Brenneria goodwinii]MCG8154739.1 hypothetical protein [Brenneria goodwinii]MCG8159924.1 hypothetical protein [Brenneria goodwinii]MCG8163977.1 hypothetical protein [Brenneria goodwinii]MCG8168586.1 hypothetical protein [Brenneria goodwinii]